MPLPPDYHMHTPLCRHAVGEPAAYAAQALQAGLTEIGFSDHSPMPRDDFDDWRMRLDQLDGYVEAIRRVQQDHPGLTVRLALEVDYLPGQESWIRQLAARHPWDYLIGSVHYVTDGWDIDNPNKVAVWQQHAVAEVWSAYWERLTQAAESGLFDIIGHADLCKKFRYYPDTDCTVFFRRFLEAARRAGAAIELNTAGLRKDCQEMYPSPTILRLAAKIGVPITFGSDAHGPGEVGLDFPAAIALARNCGYTHSRRFRQRRAELIPLPEP